MTDLTVKQKLSKHLHSFGKKYEEWSPEFNRLKGLAEHEGLTITEYYAQEFMPKKIKKPKKAFVPPDPIKEVIPEIEEIIEIPEPLIEQEIEPIIEETIPQTPEERAAEIRLEIAKLEGNEAEFACLHCGKVYATEPALKRHITMIHKEEV